MIDLRCRYHLHAQLDPEREIVSVKCAHCTRKQGRPVIHQWPLRQIIERYQRGEVVGVCEPTDPLFVSWQVRAA